MSKIQEYLKQIRLARYGKDVRQAIHDAIHQCYEDGKAGEVDLIARESVVSLREDVTEMQEDISKVQEDIVALDSKVDAIEIKTTKENTIKNTKHGGFRLTKMLANTIQNGTPTVDNPVLLLSTGDCVEFIQGWMDSNGVYQPNYDYVIISKNKIPCKSGDVLKIKTENAYTYFNFYFFLGNTFVKQDYNAPVTGGVKEHSVTVPNGVDSFYCSIQKGSTAGINALSPDTVGKVQITINGKYLGCAETHGKNLLNVAEETTMSAIGSVFNKNVDLNANIHYTLSFISSVTQSGSMQVVLYYKDGTNEALLPTVSCTANVKKSYTFTPNKDVKSLLLYNSAGAMKITKCQLEQGTVATDYEPYKETIAWFTTQYPMIKGSTLFRENGFVKAMHTRGTLNTVDVVSVGKSSTPNTNGTLFFINIGQHGFAADKSGLWTHRVYEENAKFINLGIGGFVTNLSSSGSAFLYFVSTKSIAEEALAELKAEAGYMELTLATPIIETLDTESQIALNGLETFKDVTYVEFDTRVQPLEFDAEVGTSQVGAYTLKSLNNSETAVVLAEDAISRAEDAISTMLLIGA